MFYIIILNQVNTKVEGPKCHSYLFQLILLTCHKTLWLDSEVIPLFEQLQLSAHIEVCECLKIHTPYQIHSEV